MNSDLTLNFEMFIELLVSSSTMRQTATATATKQRQRSNNNNNNNADDDNGDDNDGDEDDDDNNANDELFVSANNATTFDVNDACLSYVQGLQWCLEMYVEGLCPSYQWCYAASRAPTAFELQQWFVNRNPNNAIKRARVVYSMPLSPKLYVFSLLLFDLTNVT